MTNFKHATAFLLFAIALAGCSTIPTQRYGDEGIYGSSSFDGGFIAPTRSAYSAHYPYWSLDHFYFSQFYSPYSVVVHPWDPWLFPYSAWYWNYPYSHGRFIVGAPWYYWAPWSFQRHRPWHDRDFYDRHPTSINYRDRRFSYGVGDARPSARHQDQRLQRLQQRRSRSGGDGSLQRQRPVSRPTSRPMSRAPVNRRSPVRATQPARRSSRAPERFREQPPEPD